jgi:hypothetical protein
VNLSAREYFTPSLLPKKLEITKQKSFSCNISMFYPFAFNADELPVSSEPK